MKKGLIILFYLLQSIGGISQDCTCEMTFDWMKTTFEENDAGYDYALSRHSLLEIEQHNNQFLEKIRTINERSLCTTTINQWLDFYRIGHLSIQDISEELHLDEGNYKERTTKEISELWEEHPFSIDLFTNYINSLDDPGLEGIWETENYKIGIVKEGEKHIGFIIESSEEHWKSGHVKLRILTINNKPHLTYYLPDYSRRKYHEFELIDNCYIYSKFITLKRVLPSCPESEYSREYLMFDNSQQAEIERISDETLYMKLPSFQYSHKARIDSLLELRRDEILRTPNLIIDLRDNGGGTDPCFKEIIQYFYTNPIQLYAVDMLATPTSVQRFREFLMTSNRARYDSLDIAEIYNFLKDSIGKRVNLFGAKTFTIRRDTVYPYPENIGIIINKNVASSGEQFLKLAKQSKKVKLFGRSTAGQTDFGNMIYVDSPCGEYRFWYAMSQSLGIEIMPFEEIGIQPDFVIDSEVPDYRWVEIVNEILIE
jgi:hypothetical protein